MIQKMLPCRKRACWSNRIRLFDPKQSHRKGGIVFGLLIEFTLLECSPYAELVILEEAARVS